MPKIIKIVDGFKIRNTLDVDFCLAGDRISYPYIPQGEIWLEKIYLPEKKKILADLNKKRLLTKKYGYKKYKQITRQPKQKISLVNIRIKLLEKRGKLKIFLANGPLVRKFDPFFTMGGHWLVYDYVPKNEVWIDSALLTKELKYVVIHELEELKLMKKGKDYNVAHDFACAYEKEARRRFAKAVYNNDD